METNLLEKEAFLATLAEPMTNVTGEVTDELDIWPYVDAIPAADLGRHTVNDVEIVYRHPSGNFDHVLVRTTAKDVYLAVIVDLLKNCVFGHYLLDLNKEYGLPHY